MHWCIVQIPLAILVHFFCIKQYTNLLTTTMYWSRLGYKSNPSRIWRYYFVIPWEYIQCETMEHLESAHAKHDSHGCIIFHENRFMFWSIHSPKSCPLVFEGKHSKYSIQLDKWKMPSMQWWCRVDFTTL